jgi:hypothetical protein
MHQQCVLHVLRGCCHCLLLTRVHARLGSACPNWLLLLLLL